MLVVDPAYIPGAECAARGLRIKLGHAWTLGTPRQHLCVCIQDHVFTVDLGCTEADGA